MEIRYFVSADDVSPFERWFDRLDAQAAAKIVTAVKRLELGYLSSIKSVGGCVLESRIDWGPGYRIYFGREADLILILLLGGTKQRQQRDIETAQRYWNEHRRRRKE